MFPCPTHHLALGWGVHGSLLCPQNKAKEQCNWEALAAPEALCFGCGSLSVLSVFLKLVLRSSWDWRGKGGSALGLWLNPVHHRV